MKISAIYIAKNEAENIARSLESVKDSVDELILVDTGSSDDTVKIFESYGGRVYYQSWQDDFSAPRNLALSKATGDWVILLDADEYFTKDSQKNIVNAIKSAPRECDGILITLKNVEKSTGKLQDKFYALRIVRRLQGLAYHGRIHEALFNNDAPLDNLCKISEAQLTIEHTGYSPELSGKKAARNLAILLDEVRDGRDIKEASRYLYECYMGLGQEKKAIEYAKLYADGKRKHVSYASRCHRALLAYYSKSQNRKEHAERLKWALKSSDDFPELPEFQAEAAECLAQWYRFSEAVLYLNRAIALVKRPPDAIEIAMMDESDLNLLNSRKEAFVKYAGNTGKLKISACVIVKNEENNLPVWLETSKLFADELIVVDTGSSDNTVDLAKKAGAKVIEIKWQNDFAAAKNVALDAATGDWIVFNDADEIFYNPESVRGFIIKECFTPQNISVVMFPMSNVDADNGNVEIERFDAVRAFKNLPELRYSGKVHEMLLLNGKSLNYSDMLKADDRMLIKHTGYSSSIIQKKVKRNLKLLLNNQPESEVPSEKYRYLAECYFGLGNYEKALNYALRSIQSPYTAVGQETEMHSIALSAMQKLEYGMDDRLAVIEDALSKYPEAPDFYAYKGLAFTEQEKYKQGYELIKKGLDMYYERLLDGKRTLSTYFNGIVVECHYTLGICAHMLGDDTEAVFRFNEAVQINPWDEKALIAIADFYKGYPDKELIEFFDEIYDNSINCLSILIGIWERNGFVSLAKFYRDRYLHSFGKPADLDLFSMYERAQYDDLSKIVKRRIVQNMQLLFVALLGGNGDFVNHSGQSKLELLSGSLQQLIKAFFAENAEDQGVNFHDFIAMLPAVLSYGNKLIVDRYLQMGLQFSDEEYIQVAKILQKHREYELAMGFYQRIPMESSAVTGGFWHGAGMCLYHLSEYKAALECLEKAEGLKSFEQGENQSYISWCREVLKNEY